MTWIHLVAGAAIAFVAGGCAEWSTPAWSTSGAKVERPTSQRPYTPVAAQQHQQAHQQATSGAGVPITIERRGSASQTLADSKPVSSRPEVEPSTAGAARTVQSTSTISTQGDVHSTGSTHPAAISFNNNTGGASASGPGVTPVSTGASSRAGFKAFGELDSSGSMLTGELDEGVNIAQITDAAEGACFDPTINRTGEFLVFASTMHRPTADLYLKSVDGRTITQLTADPADDVMPAITPDSQRVAFASNRSGNWDIYTMSLAGGQVTQVTTDPDAELHPTWSPDGRYLAYCKHGAQSQRWEIWIVDVNNLAAPRFVEYGLFPKWSPDPARSKLLFQRPRQRGSRYHSIWTVDIIGNEAVHPTEIVSAANAAVINPTWSPDGSRIAFVTVIEPEERVSESIEQSDVWVVNLDGTGRTNLTNGQHANFQPVWGPDGKVFFVSNRSGADNIWMVSATQSLGSPTSPSAIVNANTDNRNVDE